MSTRLTRAITLLVLILASVPVFAQKVTYDWDKDIDFTPYRTYKWVDDLPGKSSIETTHQRILSNVDAQLQAKGLQKTADASADLYVGYQVVTDGNGKIASFNPDGEWRPGPGMGDSSKPPTGTKMKGALVVDLYDRKMKKLIWRGIVAGIFDSRQAVNYGIDKGLSKLFSYFPPSLEKNDE